VPGTGRAGATAAVPSAQLVYQRERESELRTSLRTIRTAIDALQARLGHQPHQEGARQERLSARSAVADGDTGKYPQTLAVLVEKHYLRGIPVDPIAKAADKWIVVNSDDPEDNGVKDVKSGAEGMGENGVLYVSW
jgi:general secretion pathway protein G